jgi:hypothetical protein
MYFAASGLSQLLCIKIILEDNFGPYLYICKCPFTDGVHIGFYTAECSQMIRRHSG